MNKKNIILIILLSIFIITIVIYRNNYPLRNFTINEKLIVQLREEEQDKLFILEFLKKEWDKLYFNSKIYTWSYLKLPESDLDNHWTYYSPNKENYIKGWNLYFKNKSAILLSFDSIYWTLDNKYLFCYKLFLDPKSFLQPYIAILDLKSWEKTYLRSYNINWDTIFIEKFLWYIK